MFTNLSTAQRLQVGLILGMAFLLVLGSNRIDQRHFSTVQNTVNSVHDDRVVVQNLIYRLNTIFHQKELLLVQHKTNAGNKAENRQIDELLGDFGATKLTNSEGRLLGQLNQQFSTLKDLENQGTPFYDQNIAASGDTMLPTTNQHLTVSGRKMLSTLENIKNSLAGLSEIQLSESKQLIQLSNKSLGMNIMLSNLEVVLMIIIGIAMLVLIFYPSARPLTRPSEN
ncbi:MAG: hypothetical protein WBG48_05775 [Pricia sp.]